MSFGDFWVCSIVLCFLLQQYSKLILARLKVQQHIFGVGTDRNWFTNNLPSSKPFVRELIELQNSHDQVKENFKILFILFKNFYFKFIV